MPLPSLNGVSTQLIKCGRNGSPAAKPSSSAGAAVGKLDDGGGSGIIRAGSAQTSAVSTVSTARSGTATTGAPGTSTAAAMSVAGTSQPTAIARNLRARPAVVMMAWAQCRASVERLKGDL